MKTKEKFEKWTELLKAQQEKANALAAEIESLKPQKSAALESGRLDEFSELSGKESDCKIELQKAERIPEELKAEVFSAYQEDRKGWETAFDKAAEKIVAARAQYFKQLTELSLLVEQTVFEKTAYGHFLRECGISVGKDEEFVIPTAKWAELDRMPNQYTANFSRATDTIKTKEDVFIKADISFLNAGR